jgi:hypothetical protein
MQSLQDNLFNDPALDADNELMVAGDTGTGSSTTCPRGTAEVEGEAESDGEHTVGVIVGCSNPAVIQQAN